MAFFLNSICLEYYVVVEISNIIYIFVSITIPLFQMIDDKTLLKDLGNSELSAYDSLYVIYSARVKEFAY